MPVTLPRFIKKAFATDGDRTAIPEASNNATGRAGYDKGFPPVNMQPIEAGGIPPNGTDMNGVIYDVTLAVSYIQSGKSFPFNSDFANAIGGYSVGAVVSDTSNSSLWVNGTASNIAFPAGWTNFTFSDPTDSIRGAPLLATQPEIDVGANVPKVVIPARIRFGFAFVPAPDFGYIKFPSFLGGFIIQWGVTQSGNGSIVTSSYPIPFPNAVFKMVGSQQNVSASASANATQISNSQFRVASIRYDNVIAPDFVSWIAVGW